MERLQAVPDVSIYPACALRASAGKPAEVPLVRDEGGTERFVVDKEMARQTRAVFFLHGRISGRTGGPLLSP